MSKCSFKNYSQNNRRSLNKSNFLAIKTEDDDYSGYSRTVDIFELINR
jgi:hypothetical protein